MKLIAAAILIIAGTTSCASSNRMSDTTDPHLWLEEIDSQRSLEKVKSWNAKTLAELESDPRYKKIEAETRKILLAKDRIPYGSLRGGFVYNLWQDEKNIRGLWRRTPLAEYAKASPKWETIIDLDELAAKEQENWVWKGADCLPPDYDRCLVRLSRGGKDAVVAREFSIAGKAFVKNGFELPEAKSRLTWFDKNTAFVATDFGSGSMTKSGYPRIVKIWKRGRPLNNATELFAGKDDYVSIGAFSHHRGNRTWRFVYVAKTFYTEENHLLGADGKLIRIPVPEDASFVEVYNDHFIGITRTEWKTKNHTIKPGSVFALPLERLNEDPQVIYTPDPRSSVEDVSATQSELILTVNVDVQSQLLATRQTADGKWQTRQLPFKTDGVLAVHSSDPLSNQILVNYESFLKPDTVQVMDVAKDKKVRDLKTLPSRFNTKGLIVERFETASRDGAMIPYFVVRPQSLKPDGENPTLLYGYGGFNNSMTPFYNTTSGKTWLEEGGVYVIANIRGGGEFGPQWHEAARLKNRQKSYDDFIAVAEDLIRRKITKPKRLGIMGGSNGGLLVGATFTQRPELFNAVVCQVPLLDMLRYHKLLAGHSWMDEYGNPEDPEMRAVIRAYSPYQNLKKDVSYPRVLFTTSTRDDRVHPGHARKTAARMEELGHPFLYYENIEGRHAGAANIEQRIKMTTIEWTYLWRQLGQ